MIKNTCIITISAAKYKHLVVKKCCYDGVRINHDETCEQRAARISVGPRCVKAFTECCVVASQFRANNSHKDLQLGRLRKYDVFYQNSAQHGEFCIILCC